MLLEHPDWGVPEQGKEMGAKWKALSDEERAPWQSLAEEDKIRATREKEAYKQKLIEEGTYEEPPPKTKKRSIDLKKAVVSSAQGGDSSSSEDEEK